jgi:hypothetical protein
MQRGNFECVHGFIKVGTIVRDVVSTITYHFEFGTPSFYIVNHVFINYAIQNKTKQNKTNHYL